MCGRCLLPPSWSFGTRCGGYGVPSEKQLNPKYPFRVAGTFKESHFGGMLHGKPWLVCFRVFEAMFLGLSSKACASETGAAPGTRHGYQLVWFV